MLDRRCQSGRIRRQRQEPERGSGGVRVGISGDSLRYRLWGRSFQDFHDEVQRFFEETNAPALHDWEEAVRRVKAGQLDADWLTKRPADTKLGVEVREIDTPLSAQYNPRPCGAVAQLGERLNGIQEVEGSTPFGSTINISSTTA